MVCVGHLVWLSLGVVTADHRSGKSRSGKSGKEVMRISGRREEALAVASLEHRIKGRGLEQASHAVFFQARPRCRPAFCMQFALGKVNLVKSWGFLSKWK